MEVVFELEEEPEEYDGDDDYEEEPKVLHPRFL